MIGQSLAQTRHVSSAPWLTITRAQTQVTIIRLSRRHVRFLVEYSVASHTVPLRRHLRQFFEKNPEISKSRGSAITWFKTTSGAIRIV